MYSKSIYRDAVEYDTPHGKNLQEWFKTSSKMFYIENGDLWIITKDGGAILFTEFTTAF